jgi:ABC-type phosphate transport system ATPase subunit
MAAKNAKASERQSWLDANTNTSLIDEYTQQLSTFIAALSDGQVDRTELDAQEQRLIKLMQEIEPTLDDATHARVTRLLCELTAYNVMQTLHGLQSARPVSTFRG